MGSSFMWERTHDALRGVYDEMHTIAAEQRKDMALFLIPCIAPCMMGKIAQKARILNDSWATLVKSQADAYRPLGVTVTLAKELSSRGVGSDRHMTMSTVGLRFEVASAPQRPPQFAAQSTYCAAPTATGGDEAVERLRKLNALYETGAISRDEYDRVKTRILNEI